MPSNQRRDMDGIKKKTKSVKKKPVKKSNFIYLLIFLPILFGLVLLVTGFINTNLTLLKLIKTGRYLVLFQNNAEIRPSGGFIGSFAIIEFDNYNLKKIDFNTNIYKLDKAFIQEHTVPPPAQLEEISGGRWALRDANWAVSFPEASEKLKWFYKQETNEDVDGVIAVNATLVKKIIELTGPVRLENYDTEINAENFFTELTGKIEKDYFDNKDNLLANEPKSILKDMMPIIFNRAMALSKMKLINIFHQALLQKEVLIYSNDPNIEDSILSKNWGGAVNNTSGDYLYINHANIFGSKSSQNIKESIDYNVTKEDDLLKSKLILNRNHLGTGVWPDGTNRNWTRVLVPHGSSLQKAMMDGKEITSQVEKGEEAGKTYFATWLVTEAGQTTSFSLEYTLPMKPGEKYNLLVQKQSGGSNVGLKVNYQNEMLYYDSFLKDVKVVKKPPIRLTNFWKFWYN